MRIIDRKTFLACPENTLYSKYAPQYFDSMEIKGETWKHCNDFLSQNIHDAVRCDSSQEYSEVLSAAEENGNSFEMDFDCQGRDGCFDDDQLFVIWEEEDIKSLIQRLQECLKRKE